MGRYGGVSKQAARIRKRIARTRGVPSSRVKQTTVWKGLTMRPTPIPENANPGSAVRVLSPIRFFPKDNLPRAVGVDKALILLKKQTFTQRDRPTKKEALRGQSQSFGKGTVRIRTRLR